VGPLKTVFNTKNTKDTKEFLSVWSKTLNFRTDEPQKTYLFSKQNQAVKNSTA